MSNWKIGQKLVFIGCNGYCGYPNLLPKKNQIVTISGFSENGNIELEEFNIPNPYSEKGDRIAYYHHNFRPLQGEPAKSELLSSFREVVESPDCPINVPQTETV